MKKNQIEKNKEIPNQKSDSIEKGISDKNNIDGSEFSIKNKLSLKYKQIENENNLIAKPINEDKPIFNNDLLFNMREKILIEKLSAMENKNEKLEETAQILNDFLFETQKLFGMNNPKNLIKNIYNTDNEELVRKLQIIYKSAHKKIHKLYFLIKSF